MSFNKPTILTLEQLRQIIGGEAAFSSENIIATLQSYVSFAETGALYLQDNKHPSAANEINQLRTSVIQDMRKLSGDTTALNKGTLLGSVIERVITLVETTQHHFADIWPEATIPSLDDISGLLDRYGEQQRAHVAGEQRRLQLIRGKKLR